MNRDRDDRRAEHEQHAAFSSVMMLVLAVAFLCLDAPGWTLFCGILGLAWLASSVTERGARD